MPSYSETQFPGLVDQLPAYMMDAQFKLTPLQPRVDASGNRTGDKNWNPDYTNTKQDDGQYGTVDLSRYENSLTLKFSNFGFGVPDGATITGFEVEFEVHASVAGKLINQILGLSLPCTDNKGSDSVFWPAGDTTYVRGASNDLWGATSITPADVRNSGFALFFACENYIYNHSVTGHLDYVKVKVYYSTP